MNISDFDMTYFKAISGSFSTKWGICFYSPDAPNYYDANHAHINIEQLKPEVLDEIIEFYLSRKIKPRFYFYGEQDNCENICVSKGFTYELSTDSLLSIQTKETRKVLEHDENVAISQASKDEIDAAVELLNEIKEFGGVGTREKLIRKQMLNPDFCYYMLMKDNQACSVACIFRLGNIARLEDVATLKAFRGQGLAESLIEYIIKDSNEKGIDEIYLIPNNEKSERFYLKCGFKLRQRFNTGYGVYR